jgi:hypothetical protein
MFIGKMVFALLMDFHLFHTFRRCVVRYPQYLRCIGFYDEANDKRLRFFTNNFEFPALTIAQLYKCRWQVELFFKCIKQHLRIKAFFGTNENANLDRNQRLRACRYRQKTSRRRGLTLYNFTDSQPHALFKKTPMDQLFNNTAPQSLQAANLR